MRNLFSSLVVRSFYSKLHLPLFLQKLWRSLSKRATSLVHTDILYELKFEIISELLQEFIRFAINYSTLGVESLLERGIESITSQKMHKNCRKYLSKGRNVKQIVQVVVSIPSIRLRGDKEYNKFDFKLMCFVCCIVGPLESSKDACFSLRTFDCQYKLWYCWEGTLWMGENCFGKNSPGYWLTGCWCLLPSNV